MKIFTKNWTAITLLSIWLPAIFLALFLILVTPKITFADQSCVWNFFDQEANPGGKPTCPSGMTLPESDKSCKDPAPSTSPLLQGYNFCCCKYVAPVFKPVNPIIPKIQIPIPNLSLSDMIDNAEEISIPWIAEYVIALYDYALIVAVILAGLALMAGGVMWLTSSGDSGRVRKSQEIILGSVFGLILIFSGHVLLMTINPELTRFKSITVKKIIKKDIKYAVPPDQTASNCTIELGENEFPEEEDIVNSSPLTGSANYPSTPSSNATPAMGIEGAASSCGLGLKGYSKDNWYFAGTIDNFSAPKPIAGSNIFCPAAMTKAVGDGKEIKAMREDIKNSQIENKRDQSIKNIRARIFRIAQSFWLQENNKKVTAYNCSGGKNDGDHAKKGTDVHTCVDKKSGTLNIEKDRKIQLFDCGGWVGYVYICAGLAVPGGPTFAPVLWYPGTYNAKILGNLDKISDVKGGDFFGITEQHAMLKIDNNNYFECGWNTNTNENTGCVKKSPMGKYRQEFAGKQLITFPLEYIVDNTAKKFYGTK